LKLLQKTMTDFTLPKEDAKDFEIATLKAQITELQNMINNMMTQTANHSQSTAPAPAPLAPAPADQLIPASHLKLPMPDKFGGPSNRTPVKTWAASVRNSCFTTTCYTQRQESPLSTLFA
jgi:hypothetical protein